MVSLKSKFLRLFILSLVFSMSGCALSYKQIGVVTMISNRNIDPHQEYKLISTCTRGAIKEIRKSRANSVEDAVDQAVEKVPGGEFLMNARIYIVDGQYFAVEGDLWGLSNNYEFKK